MSALFVLTAWVEGVAIFMVLKDRTILATILLIVACAFGGGGSEAGLANLVVQLAALLILAFQPGTVIDFFWNAPRFPVFLIGLSLVLPLVQIIPLPPVMWQALPGRSLVQEALTLMGESDSWFPISLEWRRTFLAFLALVPAFTVVTLVWSLPSAHKRHLLMLVAVSGGVMVLLGAQQLVTGNSRLMFFSENIGTDDLHGWFANRNSAGLYLAIALTALVGVFPRGRASLKWILGAGAFAALLMLGLVLTRSRSSMALLLVPCLFAVFRIAASYVPARASRKAMLAGMAGVAMLAAGLGVLISENRQIQHSLMRFDSLDDHRPQIWMDTLTAIDRYWPVGSGIGTFDEVFQIDESLENLTPARAGRAHNDYLEIMLESGGAGLVLAAAWIAFLCIRGVQALRAGGIWCAAACILVLMVLQSISDYPLRNQTLLCVAGLVLALLIQAPRQRVLESPSQV